MVDVLGYDIGGANTKAAYIKAQNGKVESVQVAAEYFPVWKEPQKLAEVLLTLKTRLGVGMLDGLGVTMTAELSDAYQTKREGVNQILSSVRTAFPNQALYILNTNAELQSFEASICNPFSVAAANWAATGWLVAKHQKNCVIVDIGSTSTSIIPIVNGHVAARGKTDLDKLVCGELVYTGSLRTNVAAIVQSVPVRGSVVAVSSELFSLSGDVHIVLGNIREADYSSETADGRGKTVPEALARLARVVCADTEMLSEQEIFELAKYVYGEQVKQVASGLRKVYAYTETLTSEALPVVVTGLGKDFLAHEAAEQIGIDQIVDLGSLLGDEATYATPAFGVALMAAEKLEGKNVK